eukprot:4027385-Amphidinium_carterae.1
MSTTDAELRGMMATMQQGMSTKDAELQGMMETMQQGMSTTDAELIEVNSADIKQSYEVPLWIHGANIIRNNLTPFA